MTISKGDRVPHAQLTIMTEQGPSPVDAAELMAEGTTVLFAVPGAYTPTCSAQHLPGYVDHADEILGKGVDRIVCISVNDVFVMDAWGKSAGSARKSSWPPMATRILPRRWGWRWTAEP